VSVADRIAAHIRREGSIPFDAYMEHALYDDTEGFFARGRGAGRRGRDFVTSPEVGPLFGSCVARALDRWWEQLGGPDPFLVVDVGAGNGRLGREVLRARPQCLGALRYVLVERSPALRAEQRSLLPLEPADEALGPFALRAVEEELRPVPRSGPVFTSVPDLPELPIDAVVLANELFDNLPFAIAEWDGARWLEVRVTIGDGKFVEVTVPVEQTDADALARLDLGAAIARGQRVPIPRGLDAWLATCAGALHRGFVVCIDYVVDARELVARGKDWLRTYRAHGRGVSPLLEPGAQDITSDVVRAQLMHAARAAGLVVVDDRAQADWLRDLGIDELVESGRGAWERGAARGDIDAIAGRSRGVEAAALTDPGGLGMHRVVTMTTADQARGRHR
jgi:SAM-dependent MidA family methyltransferase